MTTVPLKDGRVFFIDDEDANRVLKLKWHVNKNGYVMHKKRNCKHIETVYLHRFVLNLPAGVKVDHRDHNTFNNQKFNLRPATASSNGANRGKPWGNYTSKFKGVSWFPRDARWHAQIRVKGKGIHLGYLDDEIEAARVYNAAAKKYFGEFASLNQV